MGLSLDDAKEEWKTIVKYAYISNGAALTVAISAIAKATNGSYILPVGKLPLYLFLLGLFLIGLRSFFSYFYIIVKTHEEILAKSADISKKTELLEEHKSKLKQELFAKGFMKIDRGDDNQDQKKLKTLELSQDIEKLSVNMLRALQEYPIYLSYCCFFIGVIISISRL
jgi:hypothetical protein